MFSTSSSPTRPQAAASCEERSAASGVAKFCLNSVAHSGQEFALQKCFFTCGQMFSSSLCCDRSRLQERFNLITFTSISGSVRDFAGALVPPTQEMLEKAEDWVDGLKASSCAAGRGNTKDTIE